MKPPFTWTYRQFVGGSPALDLVNTVIYPTDPEKRFDRLLVQDDAGDLRRWAAAGVKLGKLPEETAGSRMTISERTAIAGLRAAIEDVFRPAAEAKRVPGEALPALLDQVAHAGGGTALAAAEGGLAPAPGELRGSPGRRLHTHIAFAAMALAFSPELARIKSCPNCDWLFIDRSRNQRRRWCDMEVCGNRAKSRRHYARATPVRPAPAALSAHRQPRRSVGG